jgi:hypothetical protein
MEFLQLCLIFCAVGLVLKKPEKENAANIFLIGAMLLMLLVWLAATWQMVLPAGNY